MACEDAGAEDWDKMLESALTQLDRILDKIETQCMRNAAKLQMEVLGQDLAATMRPQPTPTIPPSEVAPPGDPAQELRKQAKRDRRFLTRVVRSPDPGQGIYGLRYSIWR